MADERDPEVSRRYRELGAEEPPAALDRSILAASRRSAEPRARRWYVPLAAAAVAILAVAVTVQVERRQPEPLELPPPADSALRKEEAVPLKPHAGTQQRDAVVGVERPKGPPQPITPPRAAPPPAQEQAAPAARAEARARSAEEGPDRWLERIIALRKEGRHDEADKALAEFRKRYPERSIPEAAAGKP
jgi:hypothetical protein